MLKKDQIKQRLARCWERLPSKAVPTCLHSAPILCYHSVNEKRNSHADPMLPSLFESHMAYLARNWQPISMDVFCSALLKNTRLPSRSVVVTFDDGYKDNILQACPILEKYGIPATFFVATDFIDNKVDLIGHPEWNPLTWAQVREMAKNDLFTIGSHAQSHISLSKLTDIAAQNEVRESKKRIEKKIGAECEYFAYPNGQAKDISRVAIEAVEDAGFKLAVSTFWNTKNHADNRFSLNRVMISGNDDINILELKCEGAYDYIYYICKIRAHLNSLKNILG